MSDLIGQNLGKYQIVALLGRGGMADVYKAFQPGLERYVAIKLLHSHLGDDPGLNERFVREATALARLRHPNIVRVFDFDVQGAYVYMVMEMVDGVTLESRARFLKTQGQVFPINDVAQLFFALASAIDYAHAQGTIHRDLKPSNIMFTVDGQVVLTDFGIAHIVGSARHTASGAIIGTPAYMSPEQCRGERGDPRSDVYALGVILYELVLGQLPFRDVNPFALVVKQIQAIPPYPSDLDPSISPVLEQVILKAISKEPDSRYQSAGELAAALAESVGITPLPGMIQTGMGVQVSGISLIASGTGTPSLTPPGGGTPRLSTAPFQVPALVTGFVGRESVLKDLRAALVQPGGGKLYCLTGMGGIGKTSLAIQLAHDLREYFPDGVLWGNAATSEPMAILDSWARAFACDFSSLPDLNSRAAAMRGILTDRRVLVVLDDVRSSDSVRPLLPGGANCVALLTTRDLELATLLNARIYPLSVLSPSDSLSLLVSILGEERVQAEADTAAEICSLLGYLPLAVEIAAQRLSSRHRWKLADLLTRLRSEKNRLSELKLSDREVRTSFTVSWAALNEHLQHIFACQGVFEGRWFTTQALAAVAALDERTVEDGLYTLSALSLVFEGESGLYCQHPLLADFACEQLGDAPEVYQRLSEYYLSYARQHSSNYLDLEIVWDHLSAGLRAAYQQQRWRVVQEYADVLQDAWFALGRFSDARQAYAWASEAAQKLEDIPALAKDLQEWGRACYEQGDMAEAEDWIVKSIKLQDSLQDQLVVTAGLCLLTVIAIGQSRLDQAVSWLVQAQAIREQLRDRKGIAETYYLQARINYRRGEYLEAEKLAYQALDVQQDGNDLRGAMLTSALLARTYLEMRQFALAEKYGLQAFKLSECIQDKNEQALKLDILSHIYLSQGRFETAEAATHKSLSLLKGMGDINSQALVLYQLSMIQEKKEQFDTALEAAQTSLTYARQVGDQLLIVYVMTQMGDLQMKMGQESEAVALWAEALKVARLTNHQAAIDDVEQRMLNH